MTNPNDVVNATDEFVPIQNLAGAIELQTSDGTVRFERIKVTRGLTKREYFAAMAMQGILSAQAGTKEMVQMQAEYYAKNYPGKTMNDAIAIESVNGADALINALNKQQ